MKNHQKGAIRHTFEKGEQMKLLITMVLLISLSSFASPVGLGLGMTVINEKQSSADYGWTGVVEAGTGFLGIDWGARFMGSIYYPRYSNHPGTSALGVASGTVMLESNFGMEVGGGMQYRSEEVRMADEDEFVPVLYHGWRFDLGSGHTVRPFCLFTLNERETIQAGFLVSFGR